MLSASYSRDDEAAADHFAVTIMHDLGRPTAPLSALLERLTGHDRPEAPSILATFRRKKHVFAKAALEFGRVR